MPKLKNTQGASFCHYCGRKLVFSKKPFDFSFMHADPAIQAKVKKRYGEHDRYYCVELHPPGEPNFVVRVHKQCEQPALEDGYKKVVNEHRGIPQSVGPQP